MKIVFTFLFIVLFSNSYGQNLVPNHSFEDYNSLPNGYCQWNKCNDWNNVSGNIGCENPSPDYFHVNATSSATLPITSTGVNINAITGNAIMGFLTWSGSIAPNSREYISIQLSQTLVPGNTYDVSFYLSNGINPFYGHGSNNIGLHFSNNPLTQPTFQYINVVPQIEITDIFFNNSWELFSFTYTPTSNYEYLTIGNFRDDNATNTQLFENANARSYYFIDDISIITTSSNVMINGDASICIGDSTTLSVIGDTTNIYSWVDILYPNDTISTDSTIIVSPIVTTTYVMYTSLDTLDFTVNVNFPPSIDLGPDASLCPGELLTLDASTTNTTYLWQDNTTDSTFIVSEIGTYWVQVSNSCGISSDTINVDFTPFPAVDLGNDTTICQGETIALDAYTSNATYLWQDNSAISTFNITQQGTYWVQITNSCGIAADTINVNYSQLPTVDLGIDTTLCQGDTLLLDATTSNASYLWQDNFTIPTFNVTQQGVYWVQITNNCGISTDSINVYYPTLPTVDLGIDTTLCQQGTLLLDASTSNATYLWQDNSTNPTFNVTQQGIYWVEFTVNNCSATDSILVDEKECEIILEIPNVFTPNNDGSNDIFVPVISKGVVSMNTIIYNRWGNKIFESNKLLIQWSGQDVSDGTYYWIINYTDINGDKNNQKGYVTLLK